MKVKVTTDKLMDVSEDMELILNRILDEHISLFEELNNMDSYIICHNARVLNQRAQVIKNEGIDLISALVQDVENLKSIALEYDETERGNIYVSKTVD